MNEVLNSGSHPPEAQDSKAAFLKWVINIGAILACYFLLNNPYMKYVIYNTEGSGNGYYEPIEAFIFLGNIVVTLILIQFTRLSRLLSKFKLKLIPYYISSSLLVTTLFFFINFHISVKTYFSDTELGNENPWSSSKTRSISYKFNGVMHTGNISPELCTCSDKIGLKQSTGLFGVTVNRQEFKAPEEEM